MKRCRQYEGLFLITATPSPLTAKIQRTAKAKAKTVHIDKLKEYLGAPPKSWITSTASGEADAIAGEATPVIALPVIQVNEALEIAENQCLKSPDKSLKNTKSEFSRRSGVELESPPAGTHLTDHVTDQVKPGGKGGAEGEGTQEEKSLSESALEKAKSPTNNVLTDVPVEKEKTDRVGEDAYSVDEDTVEKRPSRTANYQQDTPTFVWGQWRSNLAIKSPAKSLVLRRYEL